MADSAQNNDHKSQNSDLSSKETELNDAEIALAEAREALAQAKLTLAEAKAKKVRTELKELKSRITDENGPSTSRRNRYAGKVVPTAVGQDHSNESIKENARVESYLNGFEDQIHPYNVNMPNGAIVFHPLAQNGDLNRQFYMEAVGELLHRTNVQGPVRLHADLSLLLRNRETGELRFFYPGHLSAIASDVRLDLSKNKDVEALIDRLCEVNITEKVYNFNPHSDWEVVRILGLRLIVTYL